MYNLKIVSSAPSLMSRVGSAGKKSFPISIAEENKVVDDALGVVAKGQLRGQVPELCVEVVPQEPYLKEHKVLRGRVVKRLSRRLALATSAKLDHLAQEAEVGLVGDQREHDEVSVEAVHAVALVGLVARAAAGPPVIVWFCFLFFLGRKFETRPHAPKRDPKGKKTKKVFNFFILT